MATLFTYVLAFSLAVATALQAAPLAQITAPSVSLASASRDNQSPLTFRQDGERFVAVVSRDILDRDFVLHAEITAVTQASTGPVSRVTTLPSGSIPGTFLASGALRLHLAGDSLVLLEHAGLVNKRHRYRRQAALPLHPGSSPDAVIIDAAVLWAMVQSREPSEMMWGASVTSHFFKSDISAMSSVIADLPRVATLIQRGQGQVARYQVGLLLLPVVSHQPRLHDWRTGFMPAGDGRRYVKRWRLEKQDLAAPVSDVVEPIVFRIQENVPAQWLPYFRRGIEQWNLVFEAIGFRNALVVKTSADPPSPEVEGKRVRRDVRVNWSQTKSMGASAAAMSDPRTGEAWGGALTYNSGMNEYLQARYFSAAGAVDQRAWLSFPDSLMGALIACVVGHEVGHLLGLSHNLRGGAAYPTDSLRQPSFLQRMGPVASTMSYSLFNYVAQLEDGVAVDDLIARPGFYDRWALGWGYRPIPEAHTPEAELPFLERWRAAQDTVAYLWPHLDSRELRGQGHHMMGDDLIKSMEYGIRNLAHVAARLEPWTDTVRLGEATFQKLVVEQWQRLLVISIQEVIGIMVPQVPYPVDRKALKLLPADSAGQDQAVRSVFAHAFYGQSALLRKHVLPPKTVGAETPPPLVLFDTVTAGWDAQEWQAAQEAVLRELVENKFDVVVDRELFALSALCQELKTLQQHLVAVTAMPSRPARQAQARVLQLTLGRNKRVSELC